MLNMTAQFDAVMDGNNEEIEALAAATTSAKKKMGRKRVPLCKSVMYLATSGCLSCRLGLRLFFLELGTTDPLATFI